MQTETPLEINLLAEVMPMLRPSQAALSARDFAPGTERIRITLPVGIKAHDGKWLRDIWVNSITGKSELLGERAGFDLSIAGWVSLLINNSIESEGIRVDNPGPSFCVADRDLLIVYLRMLTFGPEIWGTLHCPHDGCGSRMDVSFDLTTLKMPLFSSKENLFSASFEYQAKKIPFTWRQPDGADQEAIASVLPESPYRALLILLSRCLNTLDGLPDVSVKALSALPREMLQSMDEIISGEMTSFDWDIDLVCPECGRQFLATLDIQEFFWEELQICHSDVWKDIHTIAFYYHWSEQEILSLSRWKRKLYLGHIQNHIAGVSSFN
jgi:hypothetical protein